MVGEETLPFPDLSFDRVLVVHGLEAVDNVVRLLREVWRVTKDDGRVIVVAPNRRGIWAHWESTPFGQGQPFSAGQIGRLLRGAFFRVEHRDTALFLPPFSNSTLLRGSRLVERAGYMTMPGVGGVTITEAVKDVYAAIPLGQKARRRVVSMERA